MDIDERVNPLNLVFNSLGAVRQHLEDPEVQEVMINRANTVFIEKGGRKHKVNVEISDEQIMAAIRVLASREGKELNAGTVDSILDVRWPGVRVCAVIPPISVNGPSMSIRKHSRVTIELEDYVSSGAMTEEAKEILVSLVKARKSLFVVGGTSSGKTTVLKALLQQIDDEDRILIIEDMPELNLKKPNVVSFETRKSGGVAYTKLVETALRYAPDRIIMGEVRDGSALDLLNVANTGHEGCMATIHANSSREGLTRFETLIMQSGTSIPLDSIQQSIATSFKNVIFMSKIEGQRQLVEILEITDFDRLDKTYRFRYLYKRRP